MWRRLVMAVGLVTAGVGVWIIVHEQTRNAACNAQGNQLSGSRIGNACLNIAALYFSGFAVLMVGLFILLFGLLMARRVRKHKLPPRRKLATGQRWDHPVSEEYARSRKNR